MPLFADVLVHRGDFTLEASINVADGETLALLGPNGSGKSTLLAAIAGLLMPERGHVEVNGRTLTSVGGTGSTSGTANGRVTGALFGRATSRENGPTTGAVTGRAMLVEPHERRVGLLGQDPLLFPHLSARENIAFGRRSRGDSVTESRTDADDWLGAVGLTGFAERRPAQLSGGQQQRVAIARALAAKPEVLLLDEPMAALDVQNASAVRTLLRERLGTTALPTIVVSHDVVDAMVLADRVAIMDDGRIVDIGDPATVLGQPINEFAANLVGLNLMHGTLGSDGSVHCEGGRLLSGGRMLNGASTGLDVAQRAAPGAARGAQQGAERGAAPIAAPIAAQSPLAAGESVIAAFPPSAVRISNDVTSGRDGFSWRATVGVLEPAVRGIRVPFVGETFAAELTTTEILSSGLREGMSVTIAVNPSLITVYRHRNAALAMAE